MLPSYGRIQQPRSEGWTTTGVNRASIITRFPKDGDIVLTYFCRGIDEVTNNDAYSVKERYQNGRFGG